MKRKKYARKNFSPFLLVSVLAEKPNKDFDAWWVEFFVWDPNGAAEIKELTPLPEVSGDVNMEVEPVVLVAVLNENMSEVAGVIAEGLLAASISGAFVLLANGLSPVERGAAEELNTGGTLLSLVLSLTPSKEKPDDDDGWVKVKLVSLVVFSSTLVDLVLFSEPKLKGATLVLSEVALIGSSLKPQYSEDFLVPSSLVVAVAAAGWPKTKALGVDSIEEVVVPNLNFLPASEVVVGFPNLKPPVDEVVEALVSHWLPNLKQEELATPTPNLGNTSVEPKGGEKKEKKKNDR